MSYRPMRWSWDVWARRIDVWLDKLLEYLIFYYKHSKICGRCLIISADANICSDYQKIFRWLINVKTRLVSSVNSFFLQSFAFDIIKYIVDILFVILAKVFIFAYWFSICCHLSTGRRNVYSPASASAPASVSTLLLSLSFISSEMFIIIENK